MIITVDKDVIIFILHSSNIRIMNIMGTYLSTVKSKLFFLKLYSAGTLDTNLMLNWYT